VTASASTPDMRRDAVLLARDAAVRALADAGCRNRLGGTLPPMPERHDVLRVIEAWRSWYECSEVVNPARRAPLTALARLLVAVCEVSP